MKRLTLAFLFCLLFCVSSFSQEAQKIDVFTKGIQCGDFQGRIDSVSAQYLNEGSPPDIKLYIIYYSGRYRKSLEYNEKTKTYDVVSLDYPHRDDGLAFAKSISPYLLRRPEVKSLKDKIILVNGGYRENTETEIWFVRQNAKMPDIAPTISEKDIKKFSPKPNKTFNLDCCYDNCKVWWLP